MSLLPLRTPPRQRARQPALDVLREAVARALREVVDRLGEPVRLVERGGHLGGQLRELRILEAERHRVHALRPPGQPAAAHERGDALAERISGGADGDHAAAGVHPHPDLRRVAVAAVLVVARRADPLRARAERCEPLVDLDLIGERRALARDQLLRLVAGDQRCLGLGAERQRRDHDVDRRARIDLHARHSVLVELGLDARIVRLPGAVEVDLGLAHDLPVRRRDADVQPVVEPLDQPVPELGHRRHHDAVLRQQHGGRALDAIARRIDGADLRRHRDLAGEVVRDLRQGQLEPTVRPALRRLRQQLVLPVQRRRPVAVDGPRDLELRVRDRRPRAVDHRTADHRLVCGTVERLVGRGLDPEPRQLERLHAERDVVDRVRRLPPDVPVAGLRSLVERERPRDHAPVGGRRLLLEQDLPAGILDDPPSRPPVERREIARPQHHGAEPHDVPRLVQRAIGDHVHARRRVQRDRDVELALAEPRLVARVELVVTVGDLGDLDDRHAVLPRPGGQRRRDVLRVDERQGHRLDLGDLHRLHRVGVRHGVVRRRRDRDRRLRAAPHVRDVEPRGLADRARRTRRHRQALVQVGRLAARVVGVEPADQDRSHKDQHDR